MVRHYDGEPIPREKLERIAATVRRTPSAGFSQGSASSSSMTVAACADG
jgi:nitroreductase